MTLEHKIEDVARTVSNGLGQISLNVSGSDPAFYKEAEELLTKYFIEVFKSGRLQGLNEALGVMPRKDEVEFKEALLTWSIRIKSLIDKK